MPKFDYTNFLELFCRPFYIVLTGETLVRFCIDNITSSFKNHDKNTCLDRSGMRLRTFADFFILANIVISHFCQYTYS